LDNPEEEAEVSNKTLILLARRRRKLAYFLLLLLLLTSQLVHGVTEEDEYTSLPWPDKHALAYGHFLV
jgi:hypothetical protein